MEEQVSILEKTNKLPEWLTKVTPLSKILAMLLFISLPFIGFYLGMKYKEATLISSPVIQETKIIKVISPTPAQSQIVNWNTYENTDKSLSFKYPNNLIPLPLGNGVVSFFENTNDLGNCKKNLISKSPNDQSCYKATFNFNGFSDYSNTGYEAYLRDWKSSGNPIDPKTYVDIVGRSWEISGTLAEVYNFNAVTTENDKHYVIDFQAGTNMSGESAESIRSFFYKILDTAKLN